ncbi:MAG: ABC transporter ATP-binding protein [Candidatus Sericytochromatia bacterium]|nr:ABC transporter ATP-binding protein [Candidatus Sericytochromatia bacterium]
MTDTSAPVLLLDKVSKSYGAQPALSELSLSLAAGEIYCLLGHNGAGKTTTVNLILNFIQPDRGDIRVCGHGLNQEPVAARRQMAYIPEQVMLYPELKATENLAYFTRLAGFRYSKDQLETCLLRAGLPHKALRLPVGQFSKGMRQKVGIAIALAKQARLLVLDEPTSGLDPEASHAFSETLKSLAAEAVSVLMVTHDLLRVQDLPARIGVLKQGRLQQELSSQDLLPGQLEQIYLKIAV